MPQVANNQKSTTPESDAHSIHVHIVREGVCVLVKEGNFEVGVLLAKFTRPPVKSDVRFSLPPQGSFCHSTWLIKTGGT